MYRTFIRTRADEKIALRIEIRVRGHFADVFTVDVEHLFAIGINTRDVIPFTDIDGGPPAQGPRGLHHRLSRTATYFRVPRK